MPISITKGVELLDAQDPSWWEPGRIDLETLCMYDEKFCIIGQLYGNYDMGIKILGLKVGGRNAIEPVEFGLTLPRPELFIKPVPDAWPALQQAWTAEIARRRSQ